jgi:hypothetical protein
MWDAILASLGRRPRGYQLDEESLGARHDEKTVASTPTIQKGEQPSRPSLEGNDSGKACQEKGSNAPEANYENVERNSDVNFTNTRKGGYHGEAWETEETPGRKETEQSGGHRKDHEGNKVKEIGYDVPNSGAAEKDDGNGIDNQGKGT